MWRIVLFYVPMGVSSLLAALTHVIINGVLARSEQPDLTISSYAVALSLSFLLDMPMNVIRQTSSKFARDQASFRAVAFLVAVVVGILLTLSVAIGWTPFGAFLFRHVFGVNDSLLAPTVHVYQVLAFMYLFTALRSLFQGVIINQLRTGWMTIGMAVRVCAMIGMSWYFVRIGWTGDGRAGALIFVVGIMIECSVAVWEGRSLRGELPVDRGAQTIVKTRQLLPFYMPLLYSSIVLVLLNPSIQASLNKTSSPALAVAAYAVAIQLANMTAWFCASVHQIVLQFYATHRRQVLIVVTALSIISPAFLLSISLSADGNWLTAGLLGLHGPLLHEVNVLLRVLALQSALYPWIDYFAGKSMLIGKTRPVMLGKIVSVALSIALLLVLVTAYPQLNGAIAGLVTSAAAPFELLVVSFWLRRTERGHLRPAAAL